MVNKLYLWAKINKISSVFLQTKIASIEGSNALAIHFFVLTSLLHVIRLYRLDEHSSRTEGKWHG